MGSYKILPFMRNGDALRPLYSKITIRKIYGMIIDAETLDIEKTLAYLTLEEKLRLLTGDGMWHTFGAGELPRVRMSDGPNGLRMTNGATSSAVPSTCYPTLGMLANSWDPALMYSIGVGLGHEATAMGVNLLLAPGVNIKRHPLGGRNFEYLSEDPLLSGELGKAYINGVQATGVGACIKHFAANNQEDRRMTSDSIIDPRALREIYLKPFEIALEAQPEAVMCAYNKLNGVPCAENKQLLTDILRNEWGYDGAVISDWGAVRDRIVSLAAGLDLAMPDSLGLFEGDMRTAVLNGSLSEKAIDDALRHLLKLIDNVYLEPYGDFDADAHDKLAYNAAVASLVMLKNDSNFLPLTRDLKILVCGELAMSAPMQGGGSAHVSPLRSLSPLDSFIMRGIDVAYCHGYAQDAKLHAKYVEEAIDCAADADAVIVFVGQPAPTEGVDRDTLDLPEEQNNLIAKLTAAGHRVGVVVCGAGPVAMPWINRVRSIIYSGLNGQNGALAAVDALYGRINPHGKLAETFPADLSDIGTDFGGERVTYRESIFVGYRYYDAIDRRPLFPFGHGLSFSEVSYDDAKLRHAGDGTLEAVITLTNKSVRDTYEIVQVYASDRTGKVLCAKKQLAGFVKAFVEGQTTVTVTVPLKKSAFEFFDVATGKFATPSGEFAVLVGASSADIKFTLMTEIAGDFTDTRTFPAAYSIPHRAKIADADFEKLYGGPLPLPTVPPKKGEYTLGNSISDIKSTLPGKIAELIVMRRAKSTGDPTSAEYRAFVTNAMHTPLSSVAAMSDGAMPLRTARGIVEMANGHFFKGLKLLLSKH